MRIVVAFGAAVAAPTARSAISAATATRSGRERPTLDTIAVPPVDGLAFIRLSSVSTAAASARSRSQPSSLPPRRRARRDGGRSCRSARRRAPGPASSPGPSSTREMSASVSTSWYSQPPFMPQGPLPRRRCGAPVGARRDQTAADRRQQARRHEAAGRHLGAAGEDGVRARRPEAEGLHLGLGVPSPSPPNQPSSF